MLRCISQQQAVTREGRGEARQRLMQQLILVFFSQLPVQPQHAYPAILDLHTVSKHHDLLLRMPQHAAMPRASVLLLDTAAQEESLHLPLLPPS
jgi:hypothetical protein